MLDMHCHLLPGIDDGPSTLDQSICLAKHAVAHGITHAVLTPHIQPGRYNNDVQSIARVGRVFKAALESNAIPLQIALAAEVRLCAELVGMVQQENFHEICVGQLGGDRILLLEFPHSHLPPGSEQLVQHLLGHNIRPMIAHPERNKTMHHSPDRLAAFISMGCLVQLTAGSVVGDFGIKSQKCAQYFLKQGWVNVLATDAHNLNSRPPELLEGVAAAANIIGKDAADKLVNASAFEIAGCKFH
ncbi:MAG: capsular biosynthesis protein [Mariprofundus sp.]|nr:capsular biosynthesis protein [Mariprofundus sp.]